MIGPLTESQQELIAYMENMKALKLTMNGFAQQFHYVGMEHFLLEHGRWYDAPAWGGEYPQGAPKQCFGNAMILGVMSNLRYVEGLALPGVVPFPIHHAWNLDEQGALVDNTWLNTGGVYFGVEFSLGRADDAIWNGDSSVLDDYMRGHPLYREPWLGEDYERTWTPSEGRRLAKTLLSTRRRRA
jgi:hypothetical protein